MFKKSQLSFVFVYFLGPKGILGPIYSHEEGTRVLNFIPTSEKRYLCFGVVGGNVVQDAGKHSVPGRPTSSEVGGQRALVHAGLGHDKASKVN